jgi:ABC-type sugar transport system permease subunit
VATTTAAAAEARTAAAAPRRPRRGGGLTPWLFALPAIGIYLAFLVYPALNSVFFSLTDWDGLSPTYNIIGLQNYAAMLSDPVVLTAVVNNVIWTVVTIVFPVVIGLALAILLNGRVRGKPVLRMIFYTPAVLPLIAVASSGAGCTTRSTARSTSSSG